MSKREKAAGAHAVAMLPVWTKTLISALLVAHIAAVVVPPLAFISRSGLGGSPLMEPVAGFFRPYVTAMYLNHGYAFFAPDPGPNHLVDYTVEFDDGRPAMKGRFPDIKTERPRLLYHRHFMLSEALNTRFAPPEFDPEPSPPPLTASAEERERFAETRRRYEQAKFRWQHARRQYEAMRKSVENHLEHVHGGDRVKVVRVEHRPAEPEEVLAGRRLNAAESYRELPETIERGVSR
jgi:hypothetical protein